MSLVTIERASPGVQQQHREVEKPDLIWGRWRCLRLHDPRLTHYWPLNDAAGATFCGRCKGLAGARLPAVHRLGRRRCFETERTARAFSLTNLLDEPGVGNTLKRCLFLRVGSPIIRRRKLLPDWYRRRRTQRRGLDRAFSCRAPLISTTITARRRHAPQRPIAMAENCMSSLHATGPQSRDILTASR